MLARIIISIPVRHEIQNQLRIGLKMEAIY